MKEHFVTISGHDTGRVYSWMKKTFGKEGERWQTNWAGVDSCEMWFDDVADATFVRMKWS